jgi:hypothetical protein
MRHPRPAPPIRGKGKGKGKGKRKVAMMTSIALAGAVISKDDAGFSRIYLIDALQIPVPGQSRPGDGILSEMGRKFLRQPFVARGARIQSGQPDDLQSCGGKFNAVALGSSCRQTIDRTTPFAQV